jgi:hypothetical protein
MRELVVAAAVQMRSGVTPEDEHFAAMSDLVRECRRTRCAVCADAGNDGGAVQKSQCRFAAAFSGSEADDPVLARLPQLWPRELGILPAYRLYRDRMSVRRHDSQSGRCVWS